MFLVAVAAMAASAGAQGSLSAALLYHSGETAKDQGLLLKNWGSGTVSQTDEASYDGAYSIQISTRNYFQGGIVGYASPIDLGGKFEDKNNLLKITFKNSDETTRNFSGAGGGKGRVPGGGGLPGGTFPGAPGGGGRRGQGGGGNSGFPGFPGGGQGFPGAPGGSGPGFPGGGQGFPGAPGGAGQNRGFPGVPGGAGRFGGGQSGPTPMKTIRVIVTTTDGKKSEAYIPINTSSSADRRWKSVAIPLQAITGLDRTNKVIKEIAFSGDGTGTFFVGDMRVINDSTPIHGEIVNQNLNFAVGDTVTFSADGTGGSSVLKYSWDFGANTGIAEDAVGQTVKRKFRKPGKYHITLTVSDLYGLKPAFTTSVDVVVNG
jgi:hypothetical protein